MRSTKIKKIYLLLRSKENKYLEERVKDIINDELFQYLHETQPDFTTKIIPVQADITQIRLGLTDKNWNALTEEVNIVFHGAATINFTEALKMATLTNVRGTREMLSLARSCKQLKSFVHISTAFVHATPDRVGQPVLEQFYDCSFDPNFLIDLVEQLDEKKLDAITPKLIENWPNTYTFTKALAEQLVRRTAGELPISVVRPAIVMPAYREPPGWVDISGKNGPVGFIMGACLGGLHVMYANVDTILDMVPVDLANNAALVAAYETTRRRELGDNSIKIYTMTSSRTSIKIDTLHTFLEKEARCLQTPRAVWYGYVIMTASKFLFFMLSWLLHFIPGYLVDLALKLAGKKPKVIRLFKKAYKQNQVYGYFMTNYWKFGDSNLLELYKSLTPEDQIIFDCDAETVDINQYMKICCVGVNSEIRSIANFTSPYPLGFPHRTLTVTLTYPRRPLTVPLR
ncbi:male sterility protein domain-containing protein [Phthorimaea operculella]|nr:male sterility protein domain-containing protein [Phthorimaea operculella]